MVIYAKNRWGTSYTYLTCSGRKRRITTCQRQAMPMSLIEEIIEEEYRTIALSPELRDSIEELVLEDFDALQGSSQTERRELDKQRVDLTAQRQKLLNAHYAGAIPLDLLKTEQDRIGGQLVRFQVMAGPDTGFTSIVATDMAGHATTTVRGMAAGLDSVVAWTDVNLNGRVDSGEASAELPIVWSGIERYVALGDSYSSGEGAIDGQGAPSFDPATAINGINECHRSDNAYPNLVSAALRTRSHTFAACSGAIVADLVNNLPAGYVGQWHEGAQLDKLAPAGQSDPSVGLVTLSMTGNDINFARILQVCISGAGNSNSDAGCLRGATREFSKGFQLILSGGFVSVKKDGTWKWCKGSCTQMADVNVPNFAGILNEIHSRAPRAAVIIQGYPLLFPSNASSSCVVGQINASLQYSLDPVKMAALDKLTNNLDDTLSGIVNSAAARTGTKILFADPRRPGPANTAFQGHELCGGQPAWINGLVSPTITGNYSPYSFHPNALGQASFAADIKSVYLS